jgi:hypothetical protein
MLQHYRLLHRKPVGRDIFGRRKEKEIEPAVADEIARQSGSGPRLTPRDKPLLKQMNNLLGDIA